MKSWIDARAIFLALVFAVAAALPVMTTSVDRRDFYFFDVTLTSTNPGFTQLFWDSGHGQNEFDSSSQPLKVEKTPVVYRFMLPTGTITSLRFDASNQHSVMTLSRARIVDRNKKVIKTFAPEDFFPAQQIDRFERKGDGLLIETSVDGNDPVLGVRLAEPVLLPRSAFSWFEIGLPVFLPVLAAGLLLGCPAIAAWMQRRLSPAAAWATRHPLKSVSLAAAAAVAIQMHPVMFFGRSFVSPNNGSLMLYDDLPTLPGAKQAMYADGMGSDVGAILFVHMYYPIVERDALFRDGELPLWNRYSLAGVPLLGQGQSLFGDPFNSLTILAGSAAWAWDVRFAIARWLLCAGLGLIVWRLTRHLGASLLTTVAAGFLGFFTFRVNHPANFSLGYAPWILLAWVGLIQAGTARLRAAWLAALIAANWIVMSSGTVKEADMLIACLNLAGALLVALHPGAAGRRARLLALASAAGAVFVLLSAPLWMSFLTALKHSVTGYDTPQAVVLPLSQFIGLFDDIFFRQNIPHEGVMAPSLNFLFFVGVLAWAIRAKNWKNDRTSQALLLASLVPLSLAFGIVPPSLIVKMPFIANIFHVGNTFSCPLMILAAVLAGCGFRDACDALGSRRWWIGWAGGAAIAGVLASVWFATTWGQEKSSFFHGYAAALALAGLALPVAAAWGVRTSRPGLLLLAVLVGMPVLLWRHAQFLSLQAPYNHYAWVPGERVDIRAPSPAVAFIDGLKRGPGRVIGLQHNLFPAYNTALRWESLYGADALRSLNYHELVSAFGLEKVWRWDQSTPLEDAARLRPAHDMLNVTHYVANHQDTPVDIPGLRSLTRRDLDVYASDTAWPRAFFTDRIVGYRTPAELALRVNHGDGLPFAAFQAGDPDEPAPGAAGTGTVARAARDYHFTTNNTSFTVDAPGPGVAVLSETYYPKDFVVTVDGKPAPYFRVNHAFKGVRIAEAGTHTIVFAYWPEHFTLALALSAAGLASLVVGGVFMCRKPAAAV